MPRHGALKSCKNCGKPGLTSTWATAKKDSVRIACACGWSYISRSTWARRHLSDEEERAAMKIDEVAYHRNGVSGDGFHVVTFHHGRGTEKRENKIAVVFGSRHSIAVFDRDKLGAGEIASGKNSWDGPEFEDEVRAAIFEFEKARAGSPITPEEERDLRFGQHDCLPYYRSGGLILALPDGACVVCKRLVSPAEGECRHCQGDDGPNRGDGYCSDVCKHARIKKLRERA